MEITSFYRVYACGDHAVTVEFGERIDPVINREVMALFQHLKAKAISGIKDLIPAYATLTVVYDIILLKKDHPGLSVYTMICDLLRDAIAELTVHIEDRSAVIEIPACYDISLAPDIQSLAKLHTVPVEELIRIHSSVVYNVYMIGFLPGFAYMGSVEEKIISPRHASPRTQVPAGSIGIAGEQTGIYPFDSPGGWQLIGQTPVKMFDIEKENPCYLQPGDKVKFYPVSLTEFQKMKGS